MSVQSQKAYLETESGDQLECLFNPEKLQIELAATWSGATVPGRAMPTLRYGGGETSSIHVELFFDTTADGSPVTNHTDKLVRLAQIDTSLPGYDAGLKNGRPPWVRFHWGKFHSFRAVISRLDVQYVYFSADGEPLRAYANLTMLQYEADEDWPRQNPTSGTPKPARSHQLQPGETLDRVAARYYDDPTDWRRIAELNGIKDPFAVSAGTRVDVPPAEG